MQKPSIGRIVIYKESDGSLSPAMIQAVHPDGRVRLWVFGAFSTTQAEVASQGVENNQWSWPQVEKPAPSPLDPIELLSVEPELVRLPKKIWCADCQAWLKWNLAFGRGITYLVCPRDHRLSSFCE